MCQARCASLLFKIYTKITVRNFDGDVTIENGMVKCQGLVVGAQEFTTDLIFAAVDRFKASWTGPSPVQGKIYFADGSDSGAINDGDTGNVFQKTFIYYNGTANLQTTTDHAAAVSDENLLLAIVEPVVTGQGKCTITLVRNPGTTISGDTIVTGKIQSANTEAYFDLEKDEIGMEPSPTSAKTKIWIGTHILNKGEPGEGRGHIFLGRWLAQASGALPADDGFAILHDNGDYTLISEDGVHRKRSGYTLPYANILYCGFYKHMTLIWPAITIPQGRKAILSFMPMHTYKCLNTTQKFSYKSFTTGVPCQYAYTESDGSLSCTHDPAGTIYSGACPLGTCGNGDYYTPVNADKLWAEQEFWFRTGAGGSRVPELTAGMHTDVKVAAMLSIRGVSNLLDFCYEGTLIVWEVDA